MTLVHGVMTNKKGGHNCGKYTYFYKTVTWNN